MNCDDFACAGPDAAQEMIAECVAKGYWGVIGVSGSEGKPTFSYTVGLHKHGLPELIVFGLPKQVAHVILNNCAALAVENGIAFTNGQVESELANLPLTIKDCTEDGKQEYAFQAYNFYDSWEFGLQQLVIPDAKGLFPWDDKYDPKMKVLQPALYINEAKILSLNKR